VAYRDRRNDRWTARISLGGKRISQGGFTSRKNAELWEAEQRLKHERGLLGIREQSDATVEEIFRAYLAWAGQNKRPRSVDSDRTSFATWGKFFRQAAVIFVRQVTARHLTEFVAWRTSRNTHYKRPPGKRAINKDLVILRACLAWAVRSGLLPENPIPQLPLLREDRPGVPRYLSQQEIALIERIAAEINSPIRDHIAVLLRTGLRAGELLTLEVSDLDLDRNQIVLSPAKTKGRRQRVIPVAAPVKAILVKAAASGKYLLWKGEGELRCAVGNLNSRFGTILKAAAREGMDVVGVSIHTLRKTYISHLVMAGVDPVKVMAIVGHQDWSTIRRYLSLSEKYVSSAAEKLPY